jgi:hypothetical protein
MQYEYRNSIAELGSADVREKIFAIVLDKLAAWHGSVTIGMHRL